MSVTTPPPCRHGYDPCRDDSCPECRQLCQKAGHVHGNKFTCYWPQEQSQQEQIITKLRLENEFFGEAYQAVKKALGLPQREGCVEIPLERIIVAIKALRNSENKD